MNVTFKLKSANEIIQQKQGNFSKAQFMLDQQVAKDSNYYAPEDVGTLQDSVLLYSRFGSGQLTWNTEYARKQYYELENKSKDKNPNARMKWFEVAKSEKKDDWVKVANYAYSN
jgi:hypothetical protein